MAEGNKQILLVGSPNSGKSSVFNHLSGLKQKVGNYPGVTVDKRVGNVALSNGEVVDLIDLPGTYSLYPTSQDERVVLNVLLDERNKDNIDQVLYIANATNIEKSLLLLTQIIDLGYQVTCCLNLTDTAALSGIEINPEALEKELGIPVLSINGRTGEGVDQLRTTLAVPPPKRRETFHQVNELPSDVTDTLDQLGIDNHPYLRQLFTCNAGNNEQLDKDQRERVTVAIEKAGFNTLKTEINDKLSRLDGIEEMVSRVKSINKPDNPTLTNKLDRVLTHKIWGTIIFLGLLFVIFQAIFSLASYPMDWIDSGIASLNQFLQSTLPPSLWVSFLTDGIISGLGGIVIFVPQIAILFGLIAILEESGYMARAVYLSDRFMHEMGLNGRSVVSLISGVACAVPAIMATRTIGNWKERVITIFVTPFMSCSARLPVYIILSGFVVPNKYLAGMVSYQGLVMFGLYILGAIAAVGSSWLISKFMKKQRSSTLVMELPAYQKPALRDVFMTMYEKSRLFVFNAGKIILVIAMLLWVLASFGPGESLDKAETLARTESIEKNLDAQETENLVASKKLEMSYAGRLGKMMEPAIKPLGFDWKIGIALITSFAAREVFVSTMATIYSVGSAEDDQTIIESMRKQTISGTNEKVYSPARALSLLMFYVFAMQCMSTLAVVKRETKSWAIPVYQFVFMTGIAYLASLLTFQLLS